MAYQPLVFSRQIHFSINKQFKCKYSLIGKKFLAVQFGQAVLIQLIQFRIGTGFVYTQLTWKCFDM